MCFLRLDIATLSRGKNRLAFHFMDPALLMQTLDGFSHFAARQLLDRLFQGTGDAGLPSIGQTLHCRLSLRDPTSRPA